MFTNCGCFERKRRSSSIEDSSSCRSSEIERGVVNPSQPSPSGFLKYLTSKGWCRTFRKPGRGMSMTKVERVIKATLLIQRWYRRYLARVEMKRRCTWTIFQNIEYAGEQDQVRLYNFFNALLMHMPEAAKKFSEQDDLSTSSTDSADDNYVDESDESLDEGIEAPEKTYRGPHLTFPLTRQDLDMLINLFRKKKYRLHARYVALILREAAKKLRRMENINRASTAISRSVTVVGDLHGKLDDLLVILYKNGLPSVDNCYVFNGDFVDRGKKGLEVLLILLVCLLIYPGGVYLNRGNHEDAVMNHRYGFTREVHQKYKHNAERLLKLIDQVYRHLPLATLINNKIFVVHGGISDSTNLDLLNSVRRSKYISILRPPVSAAESMSAGTDSVNKLEWKQLFDILWSDPSVNEGCAPNALRGAGTCFGPDITNQFLQRYNLTHIVRSHECKSDGYEMTHGGNVITVFSASNYYEIGSNKGAYIKFGPNSDRYFVQFTAAASKTRKLTFRQQVDQVEKSAIKELCQKMREHREELVNEFKKRDPENTGKLSVMKWSDAMESVTNFKLPWRLLKDKLAILNETNEVLYENTLTLIENSEIEISTSGLTVTETLYSNRASLEAIFRIIDKDNNGQISVDEFKEACTILTHYMPHYTVDQLLENCRMMDMNKDSLVDLNEFLEAFRLCQNFGNKTQIILDGISDKDTPKKEKKDVEKAEKLRKSKSREEKENDAKANDQDILDQYEIHETFESSNNKSGITRRSSIISIESLGHSTNLNHSDAPLINDKNSTDKNHTEKSTKENQVNNK